MKDGDQLVTILSMLSQRGFDTVQVSKVQGYATHATANNGHVCLEDPVCNNGADAAANLERFGQHDDVITAGPDLLRVRRFWCTIIFDFHEFIFPISRNHDGFGGTAPDAMVWMEVVSSKLVPHPFA